MKKKPKTKNIEYISILSVISAVSVVILHTNGCFWDFSKERYWITANIIESIFYFAVPIFFMITGANLIDYRKKYSTKEYTKKRIKKALIPYIFWSIIGIIYFKIAKGNEYDFISIINALLNGSAIYIYWFFPQLFIIYMIIPIISLIPDEMKNTVYKKIILIMFLFNSLIPFIIKAFNIQFLWPYFINIGNEYLIYVLLGYLISKNDVGKKKISIYILGLFGLLAHIIGTQVMSFKFGYIIDIYKGYTNVPCILYSLAIFVFIKENSNKIINTKLYKIIEFLSNYTFELYLIHFYIIDILITIFDIKTLSIFYRLGGVIIIYPVCIFITYILRKIPILKKIVP